MMKRTILLVCAAVWTNSFASAADTKFTGCLSRSGRINRIAIGDSPKRACAKTTTQVSWNAEGPKGDKGDNGEKGDTGDRGPRGLTGPIGPRGADGRDGRDGERQYEFVGRTSSSFNGVVGVFTMTRACRATYSGSRMCRSSEILKTQNPPASSGAWSWVQPDLEATVGSTLVDVSGISRPVTETLSCRGWVTSSSTYRGLLVYSANGRFAFGSCSGSFAVACCAPVEE